MSNMTELWLGKLYAVWLYCSIRGFWFDMSGYRTIHSTDCITYISRLFVIKYCLYHVSVIILHSCSCCITGRKALSALFRRHEHTDTYNWIILVWPWSTWERVHHPSHPESMVSFSRPWMTVALSGFKLESPDDRSNAFLVVPGVIKMWT